MHDTSVHMKEKKIHLLKDLTQTGLVCGIHFNIKGLFNNLLNSRPSYLYLTPHTQDHMACRLQQRDEEN